MAVVIKGSGSIEGSTGLEMGANGTTEIRGQVNVALGSSVAGDSYTSGISTASNFAPSSIPTSHRNLIINGAMLVAQRGTTSTSDNYATVDRFRAGRNGVDENPTQSQVDVSSGTTPYTLGFRKAYRITNGNQTSGLGADDDIRADTLLEAQDFANSGWNYTSASSYITLSYWVKSSVSQEFFGYLYTSDSPNYKYGWSLGTLSADTWTKITKTIPGNSNLVFNNDNGGGCWLNLVGIWGTNKTASDAAPNTWAAWDVTKRSTDQATTWYTTNDATFDITGVQLEVGSVATPFEHRSYADELLRCARYYQEQQGGSDVFMYAAKAQGTTSADVGVGLVVPLRSSPTVVCSGHRLFHSDGVGYTSSSTTPTVVQWDANHSIHSHLIALNAGGHSGVSNNECCTWALSSAALTFDSEL